MKVSFTQLMGSIWVMASVASAGPISLEEVPTTNVTDALGKRMPSSEKVVLGYRTVRPSEAMTYHNNNGKLKWREHQNIFDGEQLGPGAYLSANLGEYDGHLADDMYCVVRAKEDTVNGLKKAWIPRSYKGTELWWESEEIDDYLKKKYNYRIYKTLSFGQIADMENNLQMIIPSRMVEDKTFYVECCYKTDQNCLDKIIAYGPTQWYNLGVRGVSANSLTGNPPVQAPPYHVQ